LEIEMNRSIESATGVELITAVCRELITLARREETLACEEAARVPYWSHLPTVGGGSPSSRARPA